MYSIKRDKRDLVKSIRATITPRVMVRRLPGEVERIWALELETDLGLKAVESWANHLTSLNHYILICKRSIIPDLESGCGD